MNKASCPDLTSFSRKIRERLAIRAASELDIKDIALFHDCLVMRDALLRDLVGSTSTIVGNWERTILGLTALDVELYTSDWKALREILTSTEFRKEDGAYALRFKHAAQSRVHYKWILGTTIGLWEETSDFAKVNQWVVFDSRVNFDSLDLTNACCTEYLDFEEKLQHTNECEWPNLCVVRQCAKELFGGFNITDYPFRPRHGNGATREVKRRDADSWHKNRQFAVDGEVINYLRYRLNESEWRDSLYVPYRGLTRESILVCVPKSMTRNRTISKEPTTLQFLQQDIFQALDDYFNEHLDGRIDLHDQERSRSLALQGSADGSYATIDLSNASDSVSCRHVEEFFGGLPVYYPLMATRSTTVKVESRDGSISRCIRTQKFAPMGSAVCFPVESMVFATLCEAAVRLETGRRSRNFDYAVYGDDIVIKSCYGARLVMLLDEFGFSVNPDKSFLDGDGVAHIFREACGIEALDGRDITPLRLSRRLVSPTVNDSDHQAGLGVGLIDLLNRSYIYGYPTLRRWLNDQCDKHYWYRRLLRIPYSSYCEFRDDIRDGRIPWLDVSMPCVITDDLHDTQWCCFRRRSVSLSPIHRSEALVITAKTRQRRIHGDDNDYFAWLVKSASRSSATEELTVDAKGIVTLRPRDLKWVKTWVPLRFGTPPAIRIRPADGR